MKAIKTHISLETAKLLKDCGVESEWVYLMGLELIYKDEDSITGYSDIDAIQIEKTKHILAYYSDIGIKDIKGMKKMWKSEKEDIEIAPAYTWQEILWEYAEKFFGDEDINTLSTVIKNLLQQKKYDEADLYFREHCILIKK